MILIVVWTIVLQRLGVCIVAVIFLFGNALITTNDPESNDAMGSQGCCFNFFSSESARVHNSATTKATKETRPKMKDRQQHPIGLNWKGKNMKKEKANWKRKKRNKKIEKKEEWIEKKNEQWK